MSEDLFKDYPLDPKGKGRTYRCANGTTISDKGSRQIVGTIAGRSKESTWKFRVTKVGRALMSVSHMVDNGYRVVFDSDDRGEDTSYFVNKETGAKIPIPRSGKTYEIEMNVHPYSEAKESQQPKLFRLGRALPPAVVPPQEKEVTVP